MNKTQIQMVLAPIVGAIATWLATRYPLLDPPTWNNLVGGVVFALVTAFITWVTNKSGLASSLAAYTDTTVVTDQKTAESIPNASVVSNTDAKVVSK